MVFAAAALTNLSSLTHLAIRWLHVLVMALAVGGALFSWLSLRRNTVDTAALSIASTYERVFWAAMGLLVMTGVGNLGALAPSIPGGAWSATLSMKLLLVVLLVFGSLIRSLLVVDARRSLHDESELPRTLRAAYFLTFVSLVVVVTVAEVLAHG